jgi:isocitrate dehydrogenase
LNLPKYVRKAPGVKALQGVDIFVHWAGTDPDVIAPMVQKMDTDSVGLSMITNRGIKVWPEGFEETFCTDHWRCRFKAKEGHTLTKKGIVDLLTHAEELGIDTIKTENLYTFDGKSAYSLGQGQ